MRKFLALFAMMLVFGYNTHVANTNEQTGLGVVEQEIVVVQPVVVVEPVLTYRERLDQQVSRGEIRAITMKITAYDLSYESCEKYPSDPAYGITASGEYVQDGFVAVDPKVIPLHTRMYIENYGVVIAKDVGGAIKGNRMDIYMPNKSDCDNWGVQSRKVYILGR